MKKILYVTTLSRTINAFLVPHITALIDSGNLVDCACYIDKDRELPSELKERNVQFFDIPFTRNPLNPNNMKAFKKLIEIQEKNNYDIIHVHTPIAAMYGRLLKVKFPKLKTIYTAHGFHFHKGAPFINWAIYYPIEKIMANFTDVIITMNEEDYQRAKKFNIKEVHKVNGVGLDLNKYNSSLFDKNEVRKKLNLKEDDFVIVMIAEVNKNKNHKQMIDAVEILKNRNIDVKVLCLDTGSLFEEVKKYIKDKKLEGNIYMLGFRKDVNEIICASDIGILMSYREGLPRNIMELMACKKPVIGTDIRGIRDLVQDGFNGYLVKVGDIEETANSIKKIYKDKQLLDDMSNNAYESILIYSVDKIVNQLQKIY